MMKHIMVDIETLGRTPGAAIISLGAVAFDPYTTESLDQRFSRYFDLADVVRKGGIIEPSTVLWWAKQDGELFKKQLSGSVGLKRGLADFNRWYKSHKAERVWARGVAFDMTILEAAFRMADVAVPWKYGEVRDSRIFDDLFLDDTDFQNEVVNLYTATDDLPLHDPVADAVRQAKTVRAFLQKIEPNRGASTEPTPSTICARQEQELQVELNHLFPE